MPENRAKRFPQVPYMPYEEYKEKFKECFRIHREDGIIEVRMHTNDDYAVWSPMVHDGWGQLLKLIGEDPENEVVIISGTGERWFGGIYKPYNEYLQENKVNNPAEYNRSSYDHWYTQGMNLIWPLLYDIKVPTIGVINGYGNGHTEFPLLCDITLCAPDTEFNEPHFDKIGCVTGDGLYLALREVFGYKLANQMTLLGKSVSAQQALERGVVTDVLPREELLPKAWEYARKIMQKDRYSRRLQHEVMTQRWRKLMTDEFKFTFAMECWGTCLQTAENVRAAGEQITED